MAVFALTGALAAARERQTLVTMAFFALLTGVGGGSIRDLLIGAPVFWIDDAWVAALCLAMAAALGDVDPLVEGQAARLCRRAGPHRLYAVLGSAKALSYGVAPVPAFVMGVVTGCVGGIVRDAIAGRPSIIMRPEFHVTAAALSAVLCAWPGMRPGCLRHRCGWPPRWPASRCAPRRSPGGSLPTYRKVDE